MSSAMHILKWYQLTAVAAALLLSTTITRAGPVPEDVESYPVISIIIDDMGMDYLRELEKEKLNKD